MGVSEGYNEKENTRNHRRAGCAVRRHIFLRRAYGAAFPDNSPAAFLESNPDRTGKKVVVCVGDSITHGRVSHNYVDMTAGKLSDRGFIIVNAGVNSELAYNVLSRIDEIIRCKHDYVTILIGTNDANSSLSQENTARAVKT